MINPYELCGFIGGLLFPISLIPQIYKSFKTKHLSSISYYWQFLFMTALMCQIIYSLHFELAPIYISSSIELLFMIILTIMKIVYERN